MSPIPDEFYLYLAQKGYSNTCRGDSTGGSYTVPTVQLDSVQVKTNEMYFNISYPMIKARFDPHNQGLPLNRDPTYIVDAIFFGTGGEKMFKKYYKYYTQGTYDANAKVFGHDSIFSRNIPERFVTDTEIGSASQYNMWVNESGVFKMDDIVIPINKEPAKGLNYGPSIPAEYLSLSFTNHLIGCLIKGEGYENIEFPLNGAISCLLKDAGIVKDALNKFYALNKGKKSDLKTFSDQVVGDGALNNPRSIVVNGIAHPETLIGSGFITVSHYNEKEILVVVFDIKSIYSGDLVKEVNRVGIDIVGYPMSLVRDSTKKNNRYTNTSQTYSFTLPIDFERLKEGK